MIVFTIYFRVQSKENSPTRNNNSLIRSNIRDDRRLELKMILVPIWFIFLKNIKNTSLLLNLLARKAALAKEVVQKWT